MLLAGLSGALVAGWTINGAVGMAEEYGWRGLMWEELRAGGPVRANLMIGVVWGLWHAPLIVQGYNYPSFPGLGVLAMVAFCIGMSFVLSAVREFTGNVIPVAATHGMFNGIARCCSSSPRAPTRSSPVRWGCSAPRSSPFSGQQPGRWPIVGLRPGTWWTGRAPL